MDDERFVGLARSEIVDGNLGLYQRLFEETPLSETTDDYFREALGLFERLSGEERDVFFKILRQVSVDTVSSLFAVLDGVSSLQGQIDDFDLSYQGKKINGDLQDLFLELEEDG